MAKLSARSPRMQTSSGSLCQPVRMALSASFASQCLAFHSPSSLTSFSITVDIDIIFAKVKDKSARRISYNQFEIGIHEFAHKMGTPFEKLAKILMDTGGPVLQGTVAEANKYHDDKSLYTGMHGKPDPLSATSQSSKPAQSTVIEVGYGPAESLEEVFELYSPNGDMDGRTFAKMARDAGLLDKNLAAPGLRCPSILEI